MKIQKTIGDSDFETAIIENTLRLVLEQPSERIIAITSEAEGERHGIIVDLNIEGGMVTIADHDDEDQATGGETTFDLHDITEVETY